MVALGCLSLLILPLLGLVAGALLGGPQLARWGALVGLIAGAAISGVMAYALVKAGRRR
ncbi:hypothetical protein ACBY01_13345 [Sphingomonas sp. ac-8]|uniref:hypothetical protein n=1 Tax=Sphingomonas sp. ac-8 TaxID=3242977 RepID=UPI003A7F873F